jgi:hypothetical protein
MTRAKVPIVVVLLLACGCTGINWPYDLVKKTPVRSIERPDSYKIGRFGERLVSLTMPEVEGEELSRYAVISAGNASPTAIWRLSKAEVIGGKLAYMYASNIRSDPYANYVTGADLASTTVWNYMDTDYACVIIGEPGPDLSAGGFTRYCMFTLDAENPRRVEGTGFVTSAMTTPERVGRSLAVVSIPGSDPDELAYIALGAEGSVHLLNAALNKALAPSLEPPTGLEAEDFGMSVAAGLTGSSWPAWVAVGSETRVYVFAVWDDPATTDASPDDVWLQACYESPSRNGFGSLLHAADIQGDGATELVISADPDVLDRTNDVIVIDGTRFYHAAVPSPYPTIACEEVTADEIYECGDFADRGVTCDSHPDFGAGFAVGDLDQDGDNEVAIGAPHATVAGKARAGAVLIYDPLDTIAPISALRDATPQKNARLGFSVIVQDVAGEQEVVAGSPGSDEVFVFYCSGVGDDVPEMSEGGRCR